MVVLLLDAAFPCRTKGKYAKTQFGFKRSGNATLCETEFQLITSRKLKKL